MGQAMHRCGLNPYILTRTLWRQLTASPTAGRLVLVRLAGFLNGWSLPLWLAGGGIPCHLAQM